MKRYVCSFLFSPDRRSVLLIRKNRPAWQAGKLNRIGGKIEASETPHEAARREFREETGLDLPESAFAHVLTLGGPDDFGSGVPWEGHFYRAFGPVDDARSLTDEAVEIHPTNPLPIDTIPNLHWIIPLLLDDEVARRQYDVRIVP
jgi:8-oxo-dGTP pyrophosphatase MutT (NUDIX family)